MHVVKRPTKVKLKDLNSGDVFRFQDGGHNARWQRAVGASKAVGHIPCNSLFGGARNDFQEDLLVEQVKGQWMDADVVKRLDALPMGIVVEWEGQYCEIVQRALGGNSTEIRALRGLVLHNVGNEIMVRVVDGEFREKGSCSCASPTAGE